MTDPIYLVIGFVIVAVVALCGTQTNEDGEAGESTGFGLLFLIAGAAILLGLMLS